MAIDNHDKQFLTILCIGAVIAIGKVLVSNEKLTARLIIGRAIVGAGLSASAGAALLLVHDLSPLAIIGIASLLGTLGQYYLELIANRVIDKRLPKSEE